MGEKDKHRPYCTRSPCDNQRITDVKNIFSLITKKLPEAYTCRWKNPNKDNKYLVKH